MNTYRFVIAFAFLQGFANGAAADDDILGLPEIVPAPVMKVFVPQGFDDNDAAEIVVYGKFRNTCYSVGPVSAEVDRANNVVAVIVKAYRYSFAYCMDILVPFTKKIPLGILPKGNYAVTVAGVPAEMIASLPVAKAEHAEADDFPYAPVTDVRVSESGHTIEIEGIFPNDCLNLREVRFDREAGNILVVRPIAEFIDNGACQAREKLFSQALRLRPDVLGTHLIYVRTMNGDSLARAATFR